MLWGVRGETGRFEAVEQRWLVESAICKWNIFAPPLPLRGLASGRGMLRALLRGLLRDCQNEKWGGNIRACLFSPSPFMDPALRSPAALPLEKDTSSALERSSASLGFLRLPPLNMAFTSSHAWLSCSEGSS